MQQISKEQIKQISQFKMKKYRQLHRQFVAEGNKVVTEVKHSPLSIKHIIATNSWLQKYNNEAWEGNDMILVDEREMKKLSSQKQPEGILAVVNMPELDINEISNSDWVIVLDDIRDPGNLGTIIRLADWYGISEIVCSPTTVDVYNPKVVQSTMGSIARVRVHQCELNEFLSSQTRLIIGADLAGEPVQQIETNEPAILIIGSESHGLSKAVKEHVNQLVTIPRIGQAESLNAAMACGIILSHLVISTP